LKTIVLLLRKSANARTSKSLAVRIRLQLVAEELYAKTSTLKTNTSPNELEGYNSWPVRTTKGQPLVGESKVSGSTKFT